jgi:hypothetical protein
MSDNIQVTQGSGTTMATDEIGGVHYPYVRLALGGASEVSQENPVPVSMGATDGLATEATLASVETKLADLATEATLASVETKLADLATESTLASVETKLADLATESTLGGVASDLASIDGKMATLVAGRVPVSSDGSPATARQLSVGAASANTPLTSTVRRVSIRAVGADIRYAVGVGTQTASAASHFIAQGERLTIGVPESANIAVIRNASTDGTLELSELS